MLPPLDRPEWLLPCALILAATTAAVSAATLRARGRLRRLLGAPLPRAAAGLLGEAVPLLALALLALALLGPRLTRETTAVRAAGSDVLLLVDVSRSMDARDTPPSRLHRARRAAAELLDHLDPEDRVALAAFAGRGVLLSPLTPDLRALAEWLPALDTQLIRPGGSRIAAALDAVLVAFDRASPRPRVLVLLSDGELRSLPGEDAADAARRREVRIVAGALGSDAGARIPDAGAALRDATGRVVVTRRVLPPLRNLADATGGRLFVADAWGRLDVAAMAAEVDRERRGAGGGMALRVRNRPVVLPFAAAAFALLAAEALWAGRNRSGGTRRRAARARRVAAVTLAAALSVGAGTRGANPEAEARVDNLEARARQRLLSGNELVRLAVARADLGQIEEAAHALRAAALQSDDPTAAGTALYNLGVLALGSGELLRARDRFFDALALDPRDRRARFNLEWTLAAQARRASQPATRTGDAEPGATATDTPRREVPPPPAVDPEAADPEEGAARPASMGAQERDRWLAQIRDDPGLALRGAVHGPGGTAAPRAPRPEVSW